MVVNIGQLLAAVKEYLRNRGFPSFESPGLFQPKFGYAFSPSAGHHLIDQIVITEQVPQEVRRFSTVPDRSMRVYDLSKIGVSRRHLSFFETLVFGYCGAAERLPKEESVKELFNLFLHLNLEPDKLLVTTFGGAEAEGTKIDSSEDGRFYDSWKSLLGADKVKRTRGRRNLFYSRVIGNPGGTGCELFYLVRDGYVEIGSQVNYRFNFTGGLERTANAAILQGFGLERLLMAWENKSRIGDISLFAPLKEVVESYLPDEDSETISLFDESINKISDHVRAVCFIIYDSKERKFTRAQSKILSRLIKETKSEVNYLGIYDPVIFKELIDQAIRTYQDRYDGMHDINQEVLEKFLKIE
jgi:alanyl-tRNA synthetase